MHISETSVKRHLANVYQKPGVNSRVEAVARGLSDGWISRVDLTREGEFSLVGETPPDVDLPIAA